MATINDKVYLLTEELPYEGTTRTMIYANRQTAIENAIARAKEKIERYDYLTYSISETEPSFVISILWIEDQHPDLWIRVDEVTIH